jgi:hypothetical protein
MKKFLNLFLGFLFSAATLTGCGGGVAGTATPSLSGVALVGNLSSSTTTVGKKYLNGDDGQHAGTTDWVTPLTSKSIGPSWTPYTGGSVTVEFIEDTTGGATRLSATVDASVGTYLATYTLAGSSDQNDISNWPEGKYRVVVSLLGGTSTTLEFWKKTMRPTNVVTTIAWDSYTYATQIIPIPMTVTPISGVVTVVNNSDTVMTGQCGAGTVAVGVDDASHVSMDLTTGIYVNSYLVPDINHAYFPLIFCIDDAGNYGGLKNNQANTNIFGGICGSNTSTC